jgi:nitroreductase
VSVEARPGATRTNPSILRAVTAAPPAGNVYGWRFLVIRDQAIKDAVADRYRRIWFQEDGASAFRMAAPSRSRYRQMLDAVDYQADHLHEAPVWIVPCLIGPRTWDSGSGIYPAVQNMLLAARAFGLGATLTTMVQYDAEADALLGLPDDAHSYALLPIGYPLGKFGPVAPVALEEIVFADRWGEKWSGNSAHRKVVAGWHLLMTAVTQRVG